LNQSRTQRERERCGDQYNGFVQRVEFNTVQLVRWEFHLMGKMMNLPVDGVAVIY
jgi:hypothetical protein